MIHSFLLCSASGVSILAIISKTIEFMEWLRNEPRNYSKLLEILMGIVIFTGFLCYASFVWSGSC